MARTPQVRTLFGANFTSAAQARSEVSQLAEGNTSELCWQGGKLMAFWGSVSGSIASVEVGKQFIPWTWYFLPSCGIVCPVSDPCSPQQAKDWWSETSRGPPGWEGAAALVVRGWGNRDCSTWRRAALGSSNSHVQLSSAKPTLSCSYQSYLSLVWCHHYFVCQVLLIAAIEKFGMHLIQAR